jgi:hypothetical protein
MVSSTWTGPHWVDATEPVTVEVPEPPEEEPEPPDVPPDVPPVVLPVVLPEKAAGGELVGSVAEVDVW